MIREGKKWVLLLPSAVSVAIRHHILHWIVAKGYSRGFDEHFIAEYVEVFKRTPILGSPLPRHIPLSPESVEDWYILECGRKIDDRRFLHILAIVNSVAAYAEYGLIALSDGEDMLFASIKQHIERTASAVADNDTIKQGVTLLIGCGFGRPLAVETPEETEKWSIEFVSMPDLEVLSWLPQSSPLTIWRLIDHRRYLATWGVHVVNRWGLLNLYGFWEKTGFLMMPSELQLEHDPIDVIFPSDFVHDVRYDVRVSWDIHSLTYPSGEQRAVRRLSPSSLVSGETRKPLYGSIESFFRDGFLAAWVSRYGTWWVAAACGNDHPSLDTVFRVWDAAVNWLERAVPVWETMNVELRNGVLFALDLSAARDIAVEPPDDATLGNCVSVDADLADNVVKIAIKDPFFGSLATPVNTGERAIVAAMTEGLLLLTDKSTARDAVEGIVCKIVIDDTSRHAHLFRVRTFRDHVAYLDNPQPLFIEEADAAYSKIGVGCLSKKNSNSAHLNSVAESTRFLNHVVQTICTRMKASLAAFDREDLVLSALKHIEGIEKERAIWKRTFRAYSALRNHSQASMDTAIEQFAKFNGGAVSLRIVVEMALSECPLTSGKMVGQLDLERLMADAAFVFHLGGCSDAMFKGVMKPEVEIAPNGDVLTDPSFRSDIAEPLAPSHEESSLSNVAGQYEQYFESPAESASFEELFGSIFLDACLDEFGVSLKEIMDVCDVFEESAIDAGTCVFVARKDEIVSFCEEDGRVRSDALLKILDRFAVSPRETWNVAPQGYSNKDWFPWRFRRRLSLVARPLVKLEDCSNPRYCISPGLVTEGIVLTLQRYHEGEIDYAECTSKGMRSWVANEIDQQSHNFVVEVEEAFAKAKYQTSVEQTVSKLLGIHTDRNFGDVDVFAWDYRSCHVFIVECKNLRLPMTPNEMAEQLNRFSGQVLSNGKRDELLKHLDRFKLIRDNVPLLAKRFGLDINQVQLHCLVCMSQPAPMGYVATQFPHVAFRTIAELPEFIDSVARKAES